MAGRFRRDFETCYVFTYLLSGPPDRWPTPAPHVHHGIPYAFLFVPAAAYEQHCRPRSGRWETVSVPTREFRQLARPIENAVRWAN